MSSWQVALKVGHVEPAAETGSGRRVAGDHAGAAEAIEALVVPARLAAQQAAHGSGELGVARQGDEDAAQVVAEGAVIPVGPRFERVERDLVARHLAETALDQPGVTPNQLV